MSVRVRTTVAATVVVGIALASAAFGLLVLQRRALVHHLDDVAELRAAGVAGLADQDALPASLEVVGDDDDFVRVVRDGRVIAETPGVDNRVTDVPLPTGADPTVTKVEGSRVTALRSRDAVVYVATTLEPVDDAVEALAGALAIGAPLLLAFVAIITWIVVGRALQPVDRIRAEVAEISSRSLGRRVPVPGSDDEVGRLALTMNTMLDRLQAASASQRRFVADASHELQTPLAAVHTDLEVALRQPDATNWSEVASAVLATNERMERLVRDLLFLARSDEVRPVATQAVDVDTVVLEEVARSRAPIDTSGVEPAAVIGRRDDLARVVTNLLDNALRHASAVVSITLASASDVVLTVTDDGPGVAPEDRERIFERFTRADDVRDRATGGMGLGLAIVKEIVEAHGGTIQVDDAPGGGARFVVRLPGD